MSWQSQDWNWQRWGEGGETWDWRVKAGWNWPDWAGEEEGLKESHAAASAEEVPQRWHWRVKKDWNWAHWTEEEKAKFTEEFKG